MTRCSGPIALLFWFVLVAPAAGCDDGDPADTGTTDVVADTTTTTTSPDTSGTSDTLPMGPVCGDGAVEGDEPCDGDDLAGESCQGLGFGEGTLACASDCGAFDTSGCAAPVMCGDDLIGGSELCDGIDLGDASCQSLGFDGGVLLCNAFCDGYDTAECSGAKACGDDVVNPGELCDGTDFDGESCVTQGFAGGTLGCSADCQTLDTSGCLDACGNNLVDTDEDCDGANLGAATCESLGYGGGALSCTAQCAFDETGCVPDTCGDATIDPGEECDGAELGTATCVSLGFDAGTLACSTCLFDTGSCSTCGDGRIDGDEVCDGTDLQALTCLDLDFDGGDLACSADCLSVDTSGCTGGAPQTPSVGEVVITEIMKDPDAVTDEGQAEYFELYNPSTSVSYELMGCTIGSNGNTGALIGTSLVIAPESYVTLASSSGGTSTPGFTPDFTYDRGDVQLSNSGDTLSLSCPDDTALPQLIDIVDYGLMGFPDPKGASLNLDPSSYDATLNDDGANWCTSTTALPMSTDLGTAGAPNENCL